MVNSGENNVEDTGKASISCPEGSCFSQTEESSPDLLKNTPSNIARLEDVIEQCKGHQKYLAKTRSPSDGEDVRWYLCKVPLAEKELAASVPRTEIVGKSGYFRFSMRDSLALEASFLQREDELLAHWWKEYAECSRGPSGSLTASKITSEMLPQVGFSDDCSNELYVIDEERVGVPVKGGLYEVDLIRRHCFPVYWNGENRRVLRGHWFARKGSLDWLPIREDIAEQLELAYSCQVWHRRTFQPSGMFAARVDLQGTTEGLHALFTGEDDTWEAWLGMENSGFSFNTGTKTGYKLRRGFSSSGSLRPTQDELRQQKEEAMDDYCSQVPVGHLVFMVHGIGQRLEKANLVNDVGNFRHITASLAERDLSPYQRSIQRVLFIPCQWRRGLKLSGESAVEKITLAGVRGLRTTLGATVHDILYYMSPIYCQDIIDSVSNQLNKLYKKFLKRNPGYNGKVSLYGHSLGSVLSYDILCHQESLSSPLAMESVHMGTVRGKESQIGPDDHLTGCNCLENSESQSTGSKLSGEMPDMETAAEERSTVSDPNAVFHEDNINEHPIAAYSSITSDMEGGSTNIYCVSNLQEGFDPSLDGKINLSLSEEGYQKNDLHAEAISSPELQNHERCVEEANGIPNDDACAVADKKCEDLSDKDKLIALLEEEVKLLKARIAKLEGKDTCTDSINTGYCGLKLQGVDAITQSSQDFPGKHSLEQDCSRKSYTPSIKYTKLDFKVDTFFAVGSPLGVFLSLRNIRIGIGKGQDYWQDERISEEMPSCRQMFNIFHPFDPVAYRIEPLVCKEFISKRPVIIPYNRGGKRLHIGFQEFTEDIATRSQAVVSHLSSVKVKLVNVFRSGNKNNAEESMEDDQVKEKSYGSIMMERLTGSEDGRVDYMLQDKTFEHSYISALGAHTNYWRDYDTALFILKHLYRDIPEETDIDEKVESEGSVEQKRRQVELFFRNEAMEADTPLTFSDKSLIREFTRKARKAMSSS